MRAHTYKYTQRSESGQAGSATDSFLELFDLIGELARRRYQTAERSFATIGLTHTEARLLTLLHQVNGAAAQDALSNRLFVDRSNAGRALQRLARDGYLLSSKHKTDKRANLIQITPKGRKAVAEISKLREKMAQTFFGDLKGEQARAVAKLLSQSLAQSE